MLQIPLLIILMHSDFESYPFTNLRFIGKRVYNTREQDFTQKDLVDLHRTLIED